MGWVNIIAAMEFSDARGEREIEWEQEKFPILESYMYVSIIYHENKYHQTVP